MKCMNEMPKKKKKNPKQKHFGPQDRENKHEDQVKQAH